MRVAHQTQNPTMHQIERARELRRRMTQAERLLWRHLRARRFFGYKFRRQVPIGPFIVDLVCMDARLVIEVDGGQHACRHLQDEARDAFLAREGFRTVRFWNNEVLGNVEGVLAHLGAVLDVFVDGRADSSQPP